VRAVAPAVPYARAVPAPDRWPPLPYEDWLPTKQTVHRYTQIVGKVRMALVPFRNHWWHVTLYVTARGLSTGPMPAGDREAEIAFDFVEHRLVVTTSDGGHRALDLTHRPACAHVYTDLFAALDDLGVQVEIRPVPFDLGDSPPFDEDREHRHYDPDAVHRYWRVLAMTQRVLDRFRSRFAGKASPVQLFWHSFDLAHARYSGRPAPVPEGADPVSAEAYSHEVVAFGFWPGDERRTPYPAFYSYTAPEPDGLRDHALPEGAEWQDTGNGSLAVLPYDAVRASGDPDGLLLAFYEAAWQAGATAAGWDLSAAAPHTPAA
jgi:uncharacterized protein DUF5996